MKLTITTPGLDRLTRLWTEAPRLIEAELADGMERAVLVAEGEVIDRTPVDTGRLRNAVAHEVRANGPEVVGRVFVENVEHAAYQEWGTGRFSEWPGAAKTDIVIEAKRRKVLRFPGRNGQPVFRRRVVHPGVHPRRMFRDGAEAARPRVEAIFEGKVRKVVRILSSGS